MFFFSFVFALLSILFSLPFPHVLLYQFHVLSLLQCPLLFHVTCSSFISHASYFTLFITLLCYDLVLLHPSLSDASLTLSPPLAFASFVDFTLKGFLFSHLSPVTLAARVQGEHGATEPVVNMSDKGEGPAMDCRHGLPLT